MNWQSVPYEAWSSLATSLRFTGLWSNKDPSMAMLCKSMSEMKTDAIGAAGDENMVISRIFHG